MWELLFPLKYLAIVASQAATPELSEAGYSQVKQPVCHTSFNPATPTCTCSQKEARHRDADGFGGWGRRRRRKSCSHHYASFVCDYTENIYDFHKGMRSQNYNNFFFRFLLLVRTCVDAKTPEHCSSNTAIAPP